MFSPLAKKRFRAFRRIRRAWWSLMGLAAIFVFCLLADVVCPCDPAAVIDPATLEKYRENAVERTFDIRAARFSVGGGEVFDFEGPDDVKAKAAELASAGGDELAAAVDRLFSSEYAARTSAGDGYARVFLEPRTPPSAKESVKDPPPISYPFRPCREHPFGIDSNGFDVYARVVHGMRIALIFGLVLAFSGMFMAA